MDCIFKKEAVDKFRQNCEKQAHFFGIVLSNDKKNYKQHTICKKEKPQIKKRKITCTSPFFRFHVNVDKPDKLYELIPFDCNWAGTLLSQKSANCGIQKNTGTYPKSNFSCNNFKTSLIDVKIVLMNVRKINPYFVGNTFLLYDNTTCNFGNEWGWPLFRSKTIHGNELHNLLLDRYLTYYYDIELLHHSTCLISCLRNCICKLKAFMLDVISIFLPSLQMCVL